MVGMQDKDLIHSLGQDRINLIVLAGIAKHHLQEVFRVGEVVTRVNEWLTNRVLVAPGCNGWHLRNQAVRSDFPLHFTGDVHLVMVERRKRAYYATHDCHRVRIAAEAAKEMTHLVVDHGVMLDRIAEKVALFLGRQFAI